jgi:hypothetical protein
VARRQKKKNERMDERKKIQSLTHSLSIIWQTKLWKTPTNHHSRAGGKEKPTKPM